MTADLRGQTWALYAAVRRLAGVLFPPSKGAFSSKKIVAAEKTVAAKGIFRGAFGALYYDYL
ncbi:MAG: hypothetical protein DBX55_03890 [Verrucomicrobia bacterium]|nr:MAG: hypothetical protein DBX55_03890 [Verrucomicrobiota bacterium]